MANQTVVAFCYMGWNFIIGKDFKMEAGRKVTKIMGWTFVNFNHQGIDLGIKARIIMGIMVGITRIGLIKVSFNNFKINFGLLLKVSWYNFKMHLCMKL